VGSGLPTLEIDLANFGSKAQPTGLRVEIVNEASANANADGFTFCIQNSGSSALGAPGGGLAYTGIPKSVAVKFDLHNNAGEGLDSTGLYTGGAHPVTPSADLSSTGINLHSGDPINVAVSYDGTTLTMTETDLTNNATATQKYQVNIPQQVGGDTAFIGFTAGTGTLTATQEILNWSF
jgi:Bacterial lectin